MPPRSSMAAPRLSVSALVLLGGLAWAPALRAAEPDTLHVWLTGSAIEEAVTRAAPLSLPGVAGGGLQLSSLLYCGPTADRDKDSGEKGRSGSASGSGVGRFLALVQPRSEGGSRAVLESADCKSSVGAAAARLSAGAGGEAAVAEIAVTTRASLLRASLRDAALVRSTEDGKRDENKRDENKKDESRRDESKKDEIRKGEGKKKSASSALESFVHQVSDGGKEASAGPALTELSLKDIPLELAPGRKINVSGQATFVADGVEAVLWLADKRAPSSGTSENVHRTELPSRANARFTLGWDLAAEVLRRLESNGPFLVETQQETFEVSRLALSGNGAGAKARGKVRARSVREDFQLSVSLADADLKVADVSVEANLADCSALGLLQRVSCSSQNAARSAAAGAATNSLASRYQGKLVTQLLGTQDLRFDLQGTRLGLRLEPLSFGSAAFGLLGSAATRLEIVP